MSQLKFNNNLFLEVNELQRFKKFIDDDGYKRILKVLVKNDGIVQNASNSYFKASPKAGSSNIVTVNAGIAFDSNMEAIVMENDLDITIADVGINQWLVLSRAVKNTEIGTVTINTDGTLTGVNTEFTKVLRGQPNFPTKVKLNSTLNSGEYEVVNLISDTSVILSGDFLAEGNINYSVIGTFTPDYQAPLEDKLIYEYDSYSINVISSVDTPVLNDNSYLLAKISFNSQNILSVTDERISYMFNDPYIQNTEGTSYSNPLVSLLSSGIVGGIKSEDSNMADFELIIEHGYSVSRYELITTSTSNTFNIIIGKCNYLGNGDIPNSLFKGWLLVNRTNMKYAVIDDNVNKSLTINSFDDSIITEANDFIIVPNFKSIEYKVTISSNVDKPSVPFYFKKEITNLTSRMRFYSYFPSVDLVNFSDKVTVSIKYRLIDNSEKLYPFSNLAIAQFQNVNGQSETLSNSSFEIDLTNIEPQAKQRNYS